MGETTQVILVANLFDTADDEREANVLADLNKFLKVQTGCDETFNRLSGHEGGNQVWTALVAGAALKNFHIECLTDYLKTRTWNDMETVQVFYQRENEDTAWRSDLIVESRNGPY